MNSSGAGAHGGARAGAGRKRVLSWRQRIAVGAECERLWQEAVESRARAHYEQDPRVREIRLEQSRTGLIPLSLKKTTGKLSLLEIEDEIETILDGRSRLVSIPVKRPWGTRPRIIEDVRACY